jgi:hypothetical protein
MKTTNVLSAGAVSRMADRLWTVSRPWTSHAAIHVLFCAGGGAWFMLALDKIVAGAKIREVAGPAVVEVVRVEWIGSFAAAGVL